MLISEFASRLLLGGSLEDKLFFPPELEDDKKNNFSFLTPELPGRDDSLAFSAKGKGPKFSEFKQLKNDAQRGHCLHFFANHELQAIELMALAILKFPEMPKSLKRQIISAIQDEQKHTRLYLNRMNSCGIEFGHDHLNRFFWDALSQVNSIDSFLAGMSLTLEQANLDFAYEFKTRFAQSGDLESAKILEVVLHDEMKHVRLGLEFFKKNKANEHGEIWEAYCEAVEPPLFPSRAKAEPFQKEIRREIGFADRDIEALLNYKRSKGRPPSIYFYNSFPHDFMPVKNSEKLLEAINHDFQFIQLWLSKENDVITTEDAPCPEWLSHLRRASVKLPEFRVCKSRESFEFDELGHDHITSIHPWAMHPGMQNQFVTWNKMMKEKVSDLIDPSHYLELDSKHFACSLLNKFHKTCSDLRFGEPEHNLGLWAQDECSLKEAIKEIGSWGFEKVVLKSDYGCAGQAIKVVKLKDNLEEQAIKWANRLIQKRISIWIQPFFDIVEEVSITGCVSNGTLSLMQLNHPLTQSSGRHCGHLLNTSWTHCDEEIRRFILGGETELLELWKHTCHSILAPELKYFYRNQNLGIDSFIYRDPKGVLKFLPISELNARTTFGHVSFELQKFHAYGRVGYFWLCPMFKDAQQLLDNSINPIEVRDQKWWNGIFCLSDPSLSRGIIPLCVVAESFDSCLKLIKSSVLMRDERSMRTLTPLLNRLKMDSHTYI